MKNESKRPRKPKAYWERHIENWKASEQSQAEYCRQNNLRFKSFAYWKRRIKEKAEAVRFVPVPYESRACMAKALTPIKISVKDRYLIEVPDGFLQDTLKQVLQVLEVS